ncbi:ExeA family protein [Hydrogenophaga sp. IBVHS1]|uniref:ExeA family protein n=1 Tax=unclassified Hydrogenophaga TaxID=2610897 RepID=UPI000A2DB6B8|nr:AAA family ATPase [Hydrogenophaga sp. IBVHS1]OSZ75429.1 general secretion pathway protein [Hydrogenophaga sp. IBVHS1]
MYESFYGLREKPFSIQPDPDFLYMGKRHSLAYTMLEYAIHNRAGFTVICGEIGCGKTTLIRRLLNNLGSDVKVGLVTNTHPDLADLTEWIMLAFGQPYDSMSPVARYDAFQRFLINEYSQQRRVVLIVDEAQNVNPAAMESLRMLSNINADKDQLLQVVLVGQPQLRTLLQRPELQQFAQRVAADFYISPLNSVEVGDYIDHRLKVAGRERQLFTPLATSKIARAAHGIPRSINILCDTALVYGFAAEARLIDVHLVDEVLNDRSQYGVLGDINFRNSQSGNSQFGDSSFSTASDTPKA